MQVRDLQWLAALDEYRHVTGAAARLGTTQPTLSRALARVESEVGVAIFERRHDGVVPTVLGELVLEAARSVTSRWTQLTDDLARTLDPETGVVRLAFLDSMATSLVPQVLRGFHQAAPHVRVLLSQEASSAIAEDLDTGVVDLAISSNAPERCAWHPLQEERLVLVVPPGHRLADRRRVRLQDLAHDELVTTPPGYSHRILVDSLLVSAGVAPPISFESQDLATIEGLVAAGLGVGIVPEQFAGLSGTVGVPIASAAARRTIGLTWRSDRELVAPASRLRDYICGRPVPAP